MKSWGTLFFVTLVAGAVAVGCGKDDKGGKTEGGGAKAGAAAGGAKVSAKGGGEAKGSFETTTKEIDSDIGKVMFEVPKGWQEQKMGEQSFIYHAPGGGLHNSNFWVATTCQGGCSDIAKNLEGRAKSQIESFGSTYTDYNIVDDKALPEGGRVIHIEMKLKGKPAHQYERYLYKEGWDEAAMCSATLINEQVELLDKVVAMCDGMKVEPKTE